MLHLPSLSICLVLKGVGWIYIPVNERVTGRELVVVTGVSAVTEICEPDQVLKCARFLHSSPDGV